VRALGTVVVRADLDPEGKAEAADHAGRGVARLVVVGLPEAFLLRQVDLAVGGRERAERVEDERGVVPPAGLRVADDRASDQGDPGRAGGPALRLVPGPERRLGVLVARRPRRGAPRVERKLREEREIGAEPSRLGEPRGQALGPAGSGEDLRDRGDDHGRLTSGGMRDDPRAPRRTRPGTSR
jgi:hypothetical protein